MGMPAAVRSAAVVVVVVVVMAVAVAVVVALAAVVVAVAAVAAAVEAAYPRDVTTVATKGAPSLLRVTGTLAFVLIAATGRR